MGGVSGPNRNSPERHGARAAGAATGMKEVFVGVKPGRIVNQRDSTLERGANQGPVNRMVSRGAGRTESSRWNLTMRMWDSMKRMPASVNGTQTLVTEDCPRPVSRECVQVFLVAWGGAGSLKQTRFWPQCMQDPTELPPPSVRVSGHSINTASKIQKFTLPLG
jgi:hypothetical protein